MTRPIDVLIVGSGFAGAATAFHLSRGKTGKVLIVEREKIPGAHASGRNASLLLQSVSSPMTRRIAAASQKAYAGLRREVGFAEVGSVLLGTEEQIEAVRDPGLIPSHPMTAQELAREVPLLRGHLFPAALRTPGDGVVDTWALLNYYLDGARERGVEILYDCEVRRIDPGPPFLVETSQGSFAADVLVNGAGAWAEDVARLAGIKPPSLVPVKRHLFILEGFDGIDEGWPFVWDLQNELYFRPESGGLLFSICDEERSAHREETVSPGISEALAEKVSAHLPRFAEAEIRKVWSCFRTHAGDRSFVLGWDPGQKGFFWVAGLGGHGMGCSWEIGRLAAEGLRGRPTPAELDPARYSPAPAGGV